MDGCVGPARNQEAFAIGKNQNAIRPPAAFPLVDQASGLEIDNGDPVFEKIGSVQEMGVGRHGDITNEGFAWMRGIGNSVEHACGRRSPSIR